MLGFFKKNRQAATATRAMGVELPAPVKQLLSRRQQINSEELRINLLDEVASQRWSSDLQGIGVARRLGLIALDDASDSNPYCYITGGIAAGMVVHFNHDPEPRIEFATLDAFEGFLRGLRAANRGLGEVEVPSPAHPDQVALAAVLGEMARVEDEDTEFLLCLYMPLLRGEHAALLGKVAAHKSFFVREAVADAIGSANLPGAEAVLHALINDSDAQVRNAAQSSARRREQAGR